jgi:lipoprotein NlpD
VRPSFAWLILFFLSACSSTPERPATYTVMRGDTLYAIAWRHRLDYRDVARWNDIGHDYVIHPGQVLKLYPSRGRVASSTTGRATTPPMTSPGPPKSPVVNDPPVRWQWPVSGGTATLTTRPNGGQGLTITGRLGDEVRAAGPGRVVYTGSGLLGYGKLVIIKHNETYLSAYGHTQSVAIREGDSVVAGQAIATMGAGPQGVPMLYFEIRVHGSPGNPLALLPQR